MKDKLLLVGSGGLGRVVSEHASKKYDCFFVDDAYDIGTNICGITVVGHIADIDGLFPEFRQLVVTIGNNELREKIYINARKTGYIFPDIIADNVYISQFAKIGEGCIFLNNVCIQNGSQVGNGVVLNPNVEIHHDSFVDDNSLIYTNSVIRTNAKIGKRVKIGSNVSIGNDIEIKNDLVIENGQCL